MIFWIVISLSMMTFSPRGREITLSLPGVYCSAMMGATLALISPGCQLKVDSVVRKLTSSEREHEHGDDERQKGRACLQKARKSSYSVS